MNSSKRSGFTLIEILIVVGIIALLSTVVFVALDPVQRFADTRNSRRFSDVNNVLTAVHEYIVDNNGALPTGLTASMSATVLGNCGTCVDLSGPLTPYLKSMPLDPATGVAEDSGYSIDVDGNNIVTVYADDAENSETVQVSR